MEQEKQVKEIQQEEKKIEVKEKKKRDKFLLI